MEVWFEAHDEDMADVRTVVMMSTCIATVDAIVHGLVDAWNKREQEQVAAEFADERQ